MSVYSNKKCLLVLVTLSIILSSNGQTIGNWNSSSAQTTTGSAVGIGTSGPGAWEEIEYCQNTETGLIVTKDRSCGGSFGVFSSGGLWDNETNSPAIVVIGNESQSKFIPVGFEFLPVLSNPSRPYMSGGLATQPIYSGGQPLIWAREKDAGLPGSYGTRFIVTPDGRVGINVPSPRAPLDVRAHYNINVPVAIFGTNSNTFSRHLHLVANLGEGAYNTIAQTGDYGMFFTDGTGPDNDGSNGNGALVIAPWSTKGVGGLRMDGSGNLEVRGNIRATRLTVNSKWWPDFVFDIDYDLMSIDSLDSFICRKGHLPGIPSRDSIINSGQDVGELQRLQQLKIEELTLYIIQQQRILNQLLTILNEQK